MAESSRKRKIRADSEIEEINTNKRISKTEANVRENCLNLSEVNEKISEAAKVWEEVFTTRKLPPSQYPIRKIQLWPC